jgi:23S rRNA (cytosine1962-C5)-methyltransferase
MENKYVSISLDKGKEQSAKRFHPWIFSGAIKKINGKVSEGDVVKVFSSDGEFLAVGHYQIGSIAVRIFSFKDAEPDDNFWNEKIRQAYHLREKLGLAHNSGTNVFRLVNAEGDGMPGLIVDYYNGFAVIQSHSVGMFLIREKLAGILKEIIGKKLVAVYDKSEKTLPQKSGLNPSDGFIFGNETSVQVLEYGLKFNIDFRFGQKTGFFIDQRENRKLVETYSAGRDVLNMFSYTGGFSAYALRGGANLVHSVDSSAKVVEQAIENINLNFPGDSRHEAFEADAFEFLKNIDGKYDLIILDPPAFAKHRNMLPQALQGYKRINTRAFEQIRPGGILFTFSCSQIVPKDKFREAVFTAAAIAGRKVRILHQLSHPSDHPVDIFHPEGEYLKGLVLFVE